MRNKVKKMGVSRSSLRFRIEPCQLSLLVSILFFFFSTPSATRAAAAAASSSSTSTSSSGCINNNNNNNNNGSMIQEQQQGNYCMEENNNYNLELLSIMPVDRSSSRMLGNTAAYVTDKSKNQNLASFNCPGHIAYTHESCLPPQNSNKPPSRHCGSDYYRDPTCPRR